ncbi:MAG: hypothetical protein Q4D98_02405 [Planctomycetia bacterium]|nr:hypothetical protein [Planctomycetia bacterium]
MPLNKGHRMQQVYIGNTIRRQPDKRVLLCCPLHGDLLDVSRYRNSATYSTAPTYGSPSVPDAFDGGYYGAWNYTLTRSLDVAKPWSAEYYTYISGTVDLYFGAAVRWFFAGDRSGSSYIQVFNVADSTRNVTSSYGWKLGIRHMAATYDGTACRIYMDGVLEGTLTDAAFVGQASYVRILHTSTRRVCNLRIVSGLALDKVAPNGTYYYPVPAAFYNGFEVLE